MRYHVMKARYEVRRCELDSRLRGFRQRGASRDGEAMFRYLCLNLLSPQVKWGSAERAAEHLGDKVFWGGRDALKDALLAADYRFPEKATERIYIARLRFYSGLEGIDIVELVERLSRMTPMEARDTLIKGGEYHIEGFGMKVASHFLRGIGLSRNQLAILDSRVLKAYARYGAIDMIPTTALPKWVYLYIERQVKRWAEEDVGVPLDALDLFLWDEEEHSVPVCA